MVTHEIYSPLVASEQQVRFIKVDPAFDDATPITCSLEVASLADRPNFSALSYVWGDAASTENITVQGLQFPATVNLIAALRQFRAMAGEYSRRPIWIDAICINQSDISERNSQVLLMASIYRMAQPVIGWLGPSTEDSDAGMDIIGRIFHSIPWMAENDGDIDFVNSTHHDLEWLHSVGELWIKDFDNEPYNSCWQAIDSLLRRPYWSRVWILQEVALAKELLFMCGATTLRWDALAHFCLLAMKIFKDRPAREWMPPECAIPPHLFAYWVRDLPGHMLFWKLRLYNKLQHDDVSSSPDLWCS